MHKPIKQQLPKQSTYPAMTIKYLDKEEIKNLSLIWRRIGKDSAYKQTRKDAREIAKQLSNLYLQL